MKKLGKITLSKKYDVLSENEMKKVVGGMGSGAGSGIPLCDDGLLLYVCTVLTTGAERGKACANSNEAAETAFCGKDVSCKNNLTCRLAAFV